MKTDKETNKENNEETIYIYTWTPEEGSKLLKVLEKYLKKQREYKRRWRAKRRKEGKPT